MFIVSMILLSLGGLVMVRYPMAGLLLLLLAFKAFTFSGSGKEEAIIPLLALLAGGYAVVGTLSNIFGWGVQ